jgi:diguanylate cyclase (GGDEF)-like protein
LTLKNYSLLYLENNDDDRETFIRLFEHHFKTIFIAKTPEEGLQIFETSHPDMLLSTLQLPELKELEMIARMRKHSPHLPVIINSAIDDSQVLLKSIALHIDHYILKPTNPHLMLQALNKAAKVLTLEKSLTHSRIMMQTIIDEIPDPVLYIELDMSVSMMNKAAKELGGEGADELYPKCYTVSSKTSGACSDGSHPCPVEYVSKTKKPATLRHIHTDQKGKKHHVDIQARPIFDTEGSMIAYLEIRHDISSYLDIQNQLLHETKKLTHISMHDPLTRLPNRRLLEDRINHAIEKKSHSGKLFALFFIDLDHFKEVNDSLGHLIGDQLLVYVAKRIRKVIRKGDTIARNGGDEFVLIIENEASDEHLIAVAEKIQQLFNDPFIINGEEIFTSCSIGISIFPKDGKKAESLLNNADSAMYAAKQAGRNQFGFYSVLSPNLIEI